MNACARFAGVCRVVDFTVAGVETDRDQTVTVYPIDFGGFLMAPVRDHEIRARIILVPLPEKASSESHGVQLGGRVLDPNP